jgi:hypothetical protein
MCCSISIHSTTVTKCTYFTTPHNNKSRQVKQLGEKLIITIDVCGKKHFVLSTISHQGPFSVIPRTHGLDITGYVTLSIEQSIQTYMFIILLDMSIQYLN